MAQRSIPNGEIAAVLREIADLLEAKGENAFRVRSYRTAAASVEGTKSPVGGIAREKGVAGLQGLDGVGEKIAGLIEEYVQKGEVELLKSLEKDLPKEKRPDGQKKPPPKYDFAVKADVPVELILSIDAEYRDKARAGQLKKIAPRLQNPEKKAWLPVMAKESKGFKFTVMFSNTATAHQLE
ncbi:MAG: helix-hairpin-helix domain-containing protein, partial [Bacteroidota bacterium]